jgi:sec-independent protein translocase protein TatB
VFDIAFSELVVIGIVLLVVIGPKRLPEVARSAGRWVGRMRRFVEDLKRDMDVELRKDELAELRKVKEQLYETKQIFEQSAGSTLAALSAIPEEPSPAPPATAASESSEPVKPAAAKPPARKKAAKKRTNRSARVSHGRTTRNPR